MDLVVNRAYLKVSIRGVTPGVIHENIGKRQNKKVPMLLPNLVPHGTKAGGNEEFLFF